MVSYEEALSVIEKIAPEVQKKELFLSESAGYVLAEDFRAPFDSPPFIASAMDGYAIAEDGLKSYQVIARQPAGDGIEIILKKEQCVEIFTGGLIPANTVRVIRKEYVQRAQNLIKVIEEEKQKNIRFKGEDFKSGDSVLPKGTLLDAAKIALLASFGLEKVRCFGKPSVAVISTGSELLEPGTPLVAGKIYDSNRFFLLSSLQKFGFEVVFHTRLKDQPDQLQSALEKAVQQAKLIIFSGGVSEGDLDYIPEILKRSGAAILFHKVAIKPGKPVLFAEKDNTFIFGLPGNPVSVAVCFELFVKPLLYRLSGITYQPLLVKAALLKEKKLKREERLRILPVYYQNGRCEFLEFHGSAHLGVFQRANGFVLIEKSKELLKKGTLLDVRLI